MKTEGLDDAFNVESAIVSAKEETSIKKPNRLTKMILKKIMSIPEATCTH